MGVTVSVGRDAVNVKQCSEFVGSVQDPRVLLDTGIVHGVMAEEYGHVGIHVGLQRVHSEIDFRRVETGVIAKGECNFEWITVVGGRIEANKMVLAKRKLPHPGDLRTCSCLSLNRVIHVVARVRVAVDIMISGKVEEVA